MKYKCPKDPTTNALADYLQIEYVNLATIDTLTSCLLQALLVSIFIWALYQDHLRPHIPRMKRYLRRRPSRSIPKAPDSSRVVNTDTVEATVRRGEKSMAVINGMYTNSVVALKLVVIGQIDLIAGATVTVLLINWGLLTLRLDYPHAPNRNGSDLSRFPWWGEGSLPLQDPWSWWWPRECVRSQCHRFFPGQEVWM
ncbi:hypothetical protein [Ectothiorhodospira variabilis]|uniref:hypothetical protein n=1 Tax=Ectothiorhodospira variabilis TaxID=505694 RepID=UPI001EFB98CD|nr:hypothetical protein [Ectothiorhodospira variabilis]MCG5495686.1 hypothetical protein [Ectothiorhodospira variabilis]MCG5504582.1 hypothetical protein [Ectothiorhodospira variabilis]MCG5507710.1 hypothetical protein [Ectothiorhodospira variabilis]